MLTAGLDEIASFHLYGQAARMNRAHAADRLLARPVAETNAAFARLTPGPGTGACSGKLPRLPVGKVTRSLTQKSKILIQ
jgi:hypothetical protein